MCGALLIIQTLSPLLISRIIFWSTISSLIICLSKDANSGIVKKNLVLTIKVIRKTVETRVIFLG